ncbi:hypothetical protein K6119_11320 [Paracrocinitomix mangrovi]|uniref:hypothetical protein n=1 Tax=Paracrocinitomix mangrovi TaxID=2862509 RepID=UPI001C8DEBB5|nr:hypothetical protein [Paracrocinitomix mangrovi]UKN00324.1 hypothetical protein K6119_11320 [Paracrocinitomix mangrovi]
MDLIESIGNRKVGRKLIHPIGPKQISELLAGIPQFTEMTIFFKDNLGDPIGEKRPGWEHKKLKGNSTVYLKFRNLIDVSYNGLTENWALYMFPFHMEQSKKAKNFIVKTGLIVAKNWLVENREETWREGHRHLIVGVTEDLSEFCIFETHGERIVSKEKHYITL